jgi:D-glycero-D-manno-heptose 1,7-bisphosphate phosphatase
MIDGDHNMSIPVIGLDRDGTINQDIGLTEKDVPPYCIKPEQFKPIPGSLEAIKIIRDKGYDVVILTNQSGIQRGVMDAVDVDIVNNYMLELLAGVGCRSINGLYYSTTPFKDDPYRKPNTGMFKRATSEIGVDWKNGVYVGDKITDLKAAVKAKAKPILVKTGYGLETAKKLETFANKDLKKKTEVYDNLLAYAHSLVDIS